MRYCQGFRETEEQAYAWDEEGIWRSSEVWSLARSRNGCGRNVSRMSLSPLEYSDGGSDAEAAMGFRSPN